MWTGSPESRCTRSRSASSRPSATRHRTVGARPVQEHGELVAAEAGEHVRRAQASLEDRRDAADEAVAGLVAERVVDVLEVVDVDHEHAAGLTLALDEQHLLAELLEEAAAVEQTRQGVVVGEELQLGLERLALGHVAEQALDLALAAVVVEVHERLVAQPADRVVLGQDPVLELERAAGRLGPRALGQDPVAILVMQAPAPQRRVRLPLLRGVAEHRLDLRRDVDPARFAEAGHEGDRRQPLDELAVTPLGLAELGLRLLAVGHVDRHADVPERLAVRAADRRVAGVDGDGLAVGAAQVELDLPRAIGVPDPLEQRLPLLDVGPGGQAGDRLADRLLLREAEQRLGAAIPVGDLSVGVDGDHRGVDAVEQLGLEAKPGLDLAASRHVLGVDHEEVRGYVHVGDGQPLGLTDRGHREVDLAVERARRHQPLPQLGEELRAVLVELARAASEHLADVALGEPVGGVVEVDQHEVLVLPPPRVGGDRQALVLGPEALAAVLELLARATPLGRVDRDTHEALEPTLGVAHRSDAAVGGERGPVLAPQCELALELAVLGHLAAQLGRALVAVERPDQVAQRLAERVLGRVSV